MVQIGSDGMGSTGKTTSQVLQNVISDQACFVARFVLDQDYQSLFDITKSKKQKIQISGAKKSQISGILYLSLISSRSIA